jgi:phytoene desaturase
MYNVAEALAELARQAGVEFIFDANVEQIEIIGGLAQGVRLESGEHLQADIIVANADLPYVYQELLPDDGMVKKLAKKHYSCSVLSFFWGLDKPFPSIPPHALFLSEDYRGTFESIINELGMPANPSVYFHAPTRLDPSMAPEGQDTLISVVPIGHLSGDSDQDWETLQNLARAKIFDKARRFGISDLQDHIKFETVFTPLTWQRRYNLVKGSTHGLSHHLTQMAYFRPSNRHARFHNVYFVGASTRPGTGLPTAMVSGRLTAQRIIEESLN